MRFGALSDDPISSPGIQNSTAPIPRLVYFGLGLDGGKVHLQKLSNRGPVNQ